MCLTGYLVTGGCGIDP